MTSRARPLLLTGVVAVLGIAAVWLAVAQGWLGPDVGRGAEFCEAAPRQVVRQPANTFSNVGFVLVGLLIAWHMGRQPAGPDVVLTRGRGTAYAVLVTLLGPGSAAMHASQSTAGGHLDTTSMFALASFAAAHAITRLMALGDVAFAGLFVGLVAGCELAVVWSVEVPVVLHLGNVVFAGLLLAALTAETVLARRPGRTVDLHWGLGALGALLVGFAVWNLAKDDGPWCRESSLLQGHAGWHVLGAVAAWCLYRFYASERLTAPVPQTVARS
jgi:hypothetical protein